jgi:hypothetical protein
MTVFLCRRFLSDLREHADIRFAGRVLRKLLTSDVDFSSDADDHRFQGIDDGWIRYVSGGGTAYRVIYVRRGSDIFLYRAGEHKVEDQVTAPRSTDFSTASAVTGDAIEGVTEGRRAGRANVERPSAELQRRPGAAFLYNYRERFIQHAFAARRLVPHREVILVAPYVSFTLLAQTASFGRILDDWLGDGATVTLIALPPTTRGQLKQYEDLDARGVSVLFRPDLHAKVYLFQVDGARKRERDRSIALLGSANLTESGLGYAVRPTEELCYELPEDEFDTALEFVIYLQLQALDVATFRVRHAAKLGGD